jgi:hypothetical protein
MILLQQLQHDTAPPPSQRWLSSVHWQFIMIVELRLTGSKGQFYLTLKDSESAGLSVFKHSSADGFQIFTVLLELPLASCPWIDHATARTQSLPFS